MTIYVITSIIKAYYKNLLRKIVCYGNEDKTLTIAGIFTGLVFLLAMTPVGLIPLGFLNLTIVHIPVIIGTIVLGWKMGLLLRSIWNSERIVGIRAIAYASIWFGDCTHFPNAMGSLCSYYDVSTAKALNPAYNPCGI